MEGFLVNNYNYNKENLKLEEDNVKQKKTEFFSFYGDQCYLSQ
jgi:hypothetical protein